MVDNVRELRSTIPDTEKITINLGYVDLGQLDLMVQEGFYFLFEPDGFHPDGYPESAPAPCGRR